MTRAQIVRTIRESSPDAEWSAPLRDVPMDLAIKRLPIVIDRLHWRLIAEMSQEYYELLFLAMLKDPDNAMAIKRKAAEKEK